MIELIKQPWPWSVSGAAIALIMFALIFFGKVFGFSSNFRALCAACGAGNRVDYFKYDWKSQIWNLAFLIGSILGGYIAHQYLSNEEPIRIAASTMKDLAALGFSAPTGIQPTELFSIAAVITVKGFLILAIGGLLIGFGTRYAAGCTSGHAISGLSNLQLPSLLAVVGFFIGGLSMTFLIFPLIF